MSSYHRPFQVVKKVPVSTHSGKRVKKKETDLQAFIPIISSASIHDMYTL